jgi:hypothetical protein
MMQDSPQKFSDLCPIPEEAERRIELLLNSIDPEMNALGAALFQAVFPYHVWVYSATRVNREIDILTIKAQFRVYKKRKEYGILC